MLQNPGRDPGAGSPRVKVLLVVKVRPGFVSLEQQEHR